MPLATAFQGALGILSMINYGLAWYVGKDRAYLVSAVGMILCVGAIAVLQTVLQIVVLAAVVPVLIAGTVIYIRSMHAYYLWR